MKHQELITQLRDQLSEIVVQTEASGAMGLTDHNKIAEHLICGLLRETLDYKGLRSLNATERANFPAVDLADMDRRVAVQVTATSDLAKIKKTLGTFVKHKLQEKFDRLLVYILTRKQKSYSQSAIDKVAKPALSFNATSDVLDVTDVMERAVHLEPPRLRAALQVVQAFNRGVPIGLADEDYDPSAELENVTLNLVELFFPPTLYVADVVPEFLKRPKGAKSEAQRDIVRHHGKEIGRTIPSDYHVHSGQLLTFHDLNDGKNPFAWAVDGGTIVPLKPREFYAADDAQERVFKSLLRYAVQVKLYRQRVLWRHDVKLFAFMPIKDEDKFRDVYWQGLKRNKRRVYEQTPNKKNPNKVLKQKHFAFSTDFYRTEHRWFMSITPDWFFSFGDSFASSRFAGESIAWLKRKENNASVAQHFRFLIAWLTELDADDLFAAKDRATTNVSIGQPAHVAGHPYLPDELWLPVRLAEDDASGIDLFADSEQMS